MKRSKNIPIIVMYLLDQAAKVYSGGRFVEDHENDRYFLFSKYPDQKWSQANPVSIHARYKHCLRQINKMKGLGVDLVVVDKQKTNHGVRNIASAIQNAAIRYDLAERIYDRT